MSRKCVRWSKEALEARGWRDPRSPAKPKLGEAIKQLVVSGVRSGAIPAPIQPRQRTQSRKDVAEGFPDFCVSQGLPRPFYNYRFHPKRRWKFDAAWPLEKIAVEIDGGVWSGGRHTRGKGFIGDQQKLNAAVLAGWRTLRYTPDRLLEAIEDLKCLLR